MIEVSQIKRGSRNEEGRKGREKECEKLTCVTYLYQLLTGNVEHNRLNSQLTQRYRTLNVILKLTCLAFFKITFNKVCCHDVKSSMLEAHTTYSAVSVTLAGITLRRHNIIVLPYK